MREGMCSWKPKGEGPRWGSRHSSVPASSAQPSGSSSVNRDVQPPSWAYSWDTTSVKRYTFSYGFGSVFPIFCLSPHHSVSVSFSAAGAFDSR